MVDHHQHVGFDKLCFDGLGTHGHQGLAGEYYSSLGNSPDITGEFEAAQVVKELFAKAIFVAQVLDILLVKVQVVDVLHNLLKSRHNGVAPVVGVGSVKHVEICDLVLKTASKVTVAHGQFVKITQHC